MLRWVLGSVAVLVVAAAVVLLTRDEDADEPERTASAAAPNIVQPGAPGEAPKTLSEEEAAEVTSTPYTDADVEFVQGMIHHHAQAITMTGYVPDRGDGRSIRLLAKRMRLSQQSEIELMEKWLTARGEEPPDRSEHGHGHGGELMPGMMTDAQMARLEQSDGRDFNRLFLQGMIRHHRGAFTMIRQLHAENGGLEPELDSMVRHIEADQSIEIKRMQEML
jgi:uncharacterized protein (DUF305 family)